MTILSCFSETNYSYISFKELREVPTPTLRNIIANGKVHTYPKYIKHFYKTILEERIPQSFLNNKQDLFTFIDSIKHGDYRLHGVYLTPDATEPKDSITVESFYNYCLGIGHVVGLLRIVEKAIFDNPEHKFDLHKWGKDQRNKATHCETPACISGWLFYSLDDNPAYESFVAANGSDVETEELFNNGFSECSQFMSGVFLGMKSSWQSWITKNQRIMPVAFIDPVWSDIDQSFILYNVNKWMALAFLRDLITGDHYIPFEACVRPKSNNLAEMTFTVRQ
jgi:hypothetical protein